MDKERVDAFKVGFLFKLAEIGVMPSQLHEMVKKAFVDPNSLASSALSGAGEVGKASLTGLGLAGSGAKYGLMAAAGVPIALGAASGAADAALNAPTPEDIETLRQAEMVGLYQRLSAEIRKRQAHRVM